MPNVLDPKAVGMLDDVARLALQNSRSAPAAGKNIGAISKSKSSASNVSDDAKSAVRAADALHDMDRETGPTGIDKTLEVAGTGMGIAGMVPFFGTGALKLAGGGVKGIGGWFDSKGIKKVGEKIQAPAEFIEKTTFSGLGKKMGIGESVGKASQAVADYTAAGIAKVGKWTGASDRLSTRAFGGAERQFRKLSTHVNTLDLSKVHESLIPDMAKIHDAVKGAKTAGHLDPKFVETVTSAEAKLAELGSKAAKEGNLKPLQKVIASAGKTAGKLQSSKAWANPEAAIKAAPNAFAKTTLSHGLMNGAFIAGSGISIVTDARSFSQKVGVLKEMIYDMTGKHVSTATALFGSVPEAAKEARSVIMKSQVVKFGADAAGLLTNIRMALDKRFGILPSMAAFMIPEAVSHLVDASMHNNLEVYGAFRRNLLTKQAAGQKLTAQDYAPFIAELDPHLRAKGVAGQEFALKVAEHYAAKQAKPGEIMNDIQSGEVMALVRKVQKDNAALLQTPAVADTSSPAPRVHAAADRKNKEIVGRYSRKAVEEASLPSGITRA